MPGRSSLHSKVSPISVPENWKEAEPPVIVAPLIVVSGVVVSTVNARVAGVGSKLPAASLARTLNV